MAYIPKKHEIYDLLPSCKKNGGEVFAYPCSLLSELEKYLPEGLNMMPYGYGSYEEYYAEMDKYAESYFNNDELSNLYKKFKDEMLQMNDKEQWSVLKYVGKSDDSLFGLTHGRVYYWPCCIMRPIYDGVIDDEEFTSYWYPTEECDWEIIDDPTGMAHRTIYEKARGYASKEEYDHVMSQLNDIKY